MNTMTKCLVAMLCLDAGMPALAKRPTPKPSATEAAVPEVTSTSSPAAAREVATGKRTRPCQHQTTTERRFWPNGNALSGTLRKKENDETSSVLMSVESGSFWPLGRFWPNGDNQSGVRSGSGQDHGNVLASLEQDSFSLGGTPAGYLKVEGGHLVGMRSEASSGAARRDAPLAPGELVGAVLRGAASDGLPVDVAICAAEPAAEDPDMMWYRLEVWNEKTGAWENPCVATAKKPAPRAMAVQGVWDAQGGRRDTQGRFSFACEEGAIAKCIAVGYRPWQTKGEQSLADYHQACTRAIRADYCGNGRSHTAPGTPIDIYDPARVLEPDGRPVAGKAPTFEACWGTDGAYCIAHTRDGQGLNSIREECSERWVDVPEDLGNGDRCVMRKRGTTKASVLVLNRSYEKGKPRAEMAEAH